MWLMKYRYRIALGEVRLPVRKIVRQVGSGILPTGTTVCNAGQVVNHVAGCNFSGAAQHFSQFQGAWQRASDYALLQKISGFSAPRVY